MTRKYKIFLKLLLFATHNHKNIRCIQERDEIKLKTTKTTALRRIFSKNFGIGHFYEDSFRKV